MTWHITKTRSLIERAFGPGQLALARPSLKSVIDRQEYARYHYQEVMDLVSSFAAEHLTDRLLFDVALGQDESRIAFETLMTKLGAHVIACVQCIHSIPDILAHTFYYSLGLNQQRQQLDERAISVDSVGRLLGANPKYSDLAASLRSLSSEGQARHVAALANHGKHRSIVQPLLNEDLTGERADRHEVRFASFRYRDVLYPEITVSNLLEPEYARSSRVTIEAGEKLNDVLSALAP